MHAITSIPLWAWIAAGLVLLTLPLAWQARKPTSRARQAAGGGLPPRGASLLEQAQEAITRLDVRRATRLYRELVERDPKNPELLCAYFNAALLGSDQEVLLDSALRLLWTKVQTPTDDLRRTFLRLAQPKVLKALPMEEQLRLARRLVRLREDATALRILDDTLRDEFLRQRYGRQIADCLLGLYTNYKRNGLHKQADQIHSRLAAHFPSAEQIGGADPQHHAPSSLEAGVSTIYRGLSTTSGLRDSAAGK